MAMTLASWLASLQALLPPGAALTREPASVLTRLLSGIAAQFVDAQARIESLQRQSSDPRNATDMLGDWERLLGLPDDCMAGLDLSIPDRQRVAFGRLTEQGGQSPAYFIALAEAYGEPGCTIDHRFRPMTCNDDCNDALYSDVDLFVWRVNIPRAADAVSVMTCNDDCNDALATYAISLAECPINERKPAHTQVLFAYAN